MRKEKGSFQAIRKETSAIHAIIQWTEGSLSAKRTRSSSGRKGCASFHRQNRGGFSTASCKASWPRTLRGMQLFGGSIPTSEGPLWSTRQNRRWCRRWKKRGSLTDSLRSSGERVSAWEKKKLGEIAGVSGTYPALEREFVMDIVEFEKVAHHTPFGISFRVEGQTGYQKTGTFSFLRCREGGAQAEDWLYNFVGDGPCGRFPRRNRPHV